MKIKVWHEEGVFKSGKLRLMNCTIKKGDETIVYITLVNNMYAKYMRRYL